MNFCPWLQRRFKLKHILLAGLFLLIPSTILLALADRKERYWSYDFPAFIISAAGASLIFANTNIAMFKFTPPQMAGTVGAIFNSALQLGSAVGLAAVTSIETNVFGKNRGPLDYTGKAAAFWFLLGIIGLEIIAMIVFVREDAAPAELPESSEPTQAGDEQNKKRASRDSLGTVGERPISTLKTGTPAITVNNAEPETNEDTKTIEAPEKAPSTSEISNEAETTR